MDAMLDALADRYRRRVLVALLEHNPQDADDPQIPADIEIDADDLESLEIAMTHSHLPKLADLGFVEWDRQADTVTRGPNFEEIRPLLELMTNHVDELPEDWL